MALLQKIDKELKTALDALEKEKEAALKDLDSQVCLPPMCSLEKSDGARYPVC